MDYEWFEPNTVWLVDPVWHKPKEDLPVEFVYNGRKADFDVCWSHRSRPVKPTCGVSYLGEDKDDSLVEDSKNSEENIIPRGLIQMDDLDWTEYYLDVGSL